MNDITIEEKSLQAITEAQSLVISNNDQYLAAVEFSKRLKGLEKEVESAFRPIIEKAHAAHKQAIAQMDKYLKPLISAEKSVSSRVTSYVVAQEKARREEEERLRKENEKEQERLRARAEKAAAAGKTEKAEVLQQTADSMVAPTVAPTVEKVAGVSFRENWTAEVVDVNLVPREYMIPDMVKLNKFAKAMHDTVKVAGVVFKSEKTMVTRSGLNVE